MPFVVLSRGRGWGMARVWLEAWPFMQRVCSFLPHLLGASFGPAFSRVFLVCSTKVSCHFFSVCVLKSFLLQHAAVKNLCHT